MFERTSDHPSQMPGPLPESLRTFVAENCSETLQLSESQMESVVGGLMHALIPAMRERRQDEQ